MIVIMREMLTHFLFTAASLHQENNKCVHVCLSHVGALKYGFCKKLLLRAFVRNLDLRVQIILQRGCFL